MSLWFPNYSYCNCKTIRIDCRISSMTRGQTLGYFSILHSIKCFSCWFLSTFTCFSSVTLSAKLSFSLHRIFNNLIILRSKQGQFLSMVSAKQTILYFQGNTHWYISRLSFHSNILVFYVVAYTIIIYTHETISSLRLACPRRRRVDLGVNFTGAIKHNT